MKQVQDRIHSWILLLSPLIVLAAYYLRVDKEIIEFFFIPAAVVLSLLFALRGSYKDADQEIRLFRTFWTGQFSPIKIKLGKPLVLDEQIVVIEDEDHEERFRTSLEGQFRSGVRNRELIFKPFTWGKFKATDQEQGLRGLLQKAKAVVVVRTKELEGKSWVYAEVHAWANRKPEAPCLYVKDIDDTDRKSEIPEHYYWLTNDAKSIPWGLLQRSNSRAIAWRSVADFNRMMAKNIGILLSVSMTVGLFVGLQQRDQLQRNREEAITNLNQQTVNSDAKLKAKENESKKKMQELYLAMDTKEEFKKGTKINNDPKLNVSYWFRSDGKIRQVITTENSNFHKSFDDDRTSAIGCGFYYWDAITDWEEKKDPKRVRVFRLDSEVKDSQCQMKPEDDRKITSIACNSYNQTKTPEYTVGICVFTENPTTNIFRNNFYRHFLREKTKEFADYAVPLIRDKQLTPFVEDKQ